jgi:hypothetical protein
MPASYPRLLSDRILPSHLLQIMPQGRARIVVPGWMLQRMGYTDIVHPVIRSGHHNLRPGYKNDLVSGLRAEKG